MSPEAQRDKAYVKDIQPLLVENGHLAERVLLLSAKVYNKDGDPDSVAQAWTRDVVPLAEHLHNQAQFVTPPKSWLEDHDELVGIWGERAQAYRSLSEALVLSDVDAWKQARAQATRVKLAEEEWFKESNKRLAASNLPIDPTP